MFMKITAASPEAQKLSYLLVKHPEKVFKKDNLTAFYTKYQQDCAEICICVEYPEYKLWFESNAADADSYVTDREYALSSLFCKELRTSFATAISGQYPSDPSLQDLEMDFTVAFLPLATNMDAEKVMQLFLGCGYDTNILIETTSPPDYLPKKNRVLSIILFKHGKLSQILRDILVLIPVIDNYLHHMVSDSMVEQLEKYAREWLLTHPLRDLIKTRYLRYKKDLIKKVGDGEVAEKEKGISEDELEKRIGLSEYRTQWFVNNLKSPPGVLNPNIRSVVDAGCGSGRLTEEILKLNLPETVAMDCSTRAITLARRFAKGATVKFGSLCYYDPELCGKDCFVLQEVIEHMEPFQLAIATENIFGKYKPRVVLITTPNSEYNINWGITLRHRDHKFEWTSAQAHEWALGVANKYNYVFNSISPIGQNLIPKVNGVSIDTVTTGIWPTHGIILVRQVFNYNVEESHLGEAEIS
jgi:3' terminal RNA ribose 2'-O-methyltransferase Hen1